MSSLGSAFEMNTRHGSRDRTEEPFRRTGERHTASGESPGGAFFDARHFSPHSVWDAGERSRAEREAKQQVMALLDKLCQRDEFLAVLSHELRNPLAPIVNALHLLRSQQMKQTPLQQQACGIIERQVGRLQHLVDDLLDIARMTADKIHLRQEHVGIAAIVERGVETARPLIDQRKHELTVSLLPQPIWLYADADRLEQVMVNLLHNAAKYTAEGGHIGLIVDREGDECVVRVTDTGFGISPDLLPRVFDLFTQGAQSAGHSQGGLGIGLSLVRQLVGLHAGTVEAFSVLGQGSEFVVRLPIATPANVMLRSPAQDIA